MASGHPDKAISDFDRALELKPDYPQAYTNRGNAYLRQGHFGQAFDDFRKGGANPVRTIALVCGLLVILVLPGIILIVTVRQRLFARRRPILV